MEFDSFDEISKSPSDDEILDDLDSDRDQFEDYLAQRAAGELPDEEVEVKPDEEVDEVVDEVEENDLEAPIIIDDDLITSGLPYTKTHKMLEAKKTRSVKEMEPPTEKRTILEGREAPIIGKYIVERQVNIPNYPWKAEVWNNTHHLAITEMNLDQIRKIQEDNEEAIAKLKIQNHALTAAQEALLLKMSPEEAEAFRARVAKDKSYKPKKKATAKTSGITRTKSGQVRAKSAAEKYAKANQDMALTKEENITELKEMGPKFWNKDIASFIDAIYE